MNQLKVFTIEEANRLLPELAGMIMELQTKQRDILAKEVEIDSLELITRGTEEKPSGEMAREIEIYNEWIGQFYSLIDRIHEKGCFLKDIQTGLLDFYSLYQGRVVYLCWRLGEEEVGFWHDVGSGYAYRQPIVEDNERESSG